MIIRLLALVSVACTVSCAQKIDVPPTTRPTAPRTLQSSTVSVAPADPSATRANDIANREIIRRQEMLRRADEAALKASQAMANGDLESAVSGYRSASQAVR